MDRSGVRGGDGGQSPVPPTRGRLLGRGFLEKELKHTRPWRTLDTPQLASPGIDGRLPVLVQRSGSTVRSTWPVTYRRMVDMSADSHRFRSAPEDDGWLPLYEGKMVQAFDHRAADVVVNENNLFRPARQRRLQNPEKASPDRQPQWRHYVKVDARLVLA
ncbi:MAG: hypothetical protein F4Z10_01695 [Synechococcus sp. SB0666_bin_14]|nr:hypothetical protein [Synechococcus sp. SB0666_bin_14]MYG45964.1 hypothetical protein [Synechococcus sp. SB0675_bin_6]MYJ59113.1 hypothetical protein [Synechococcus sp. SB0672_bin_6]MYK90692.1 hypothetical protein [Synechococcus sp. SB0669_bin_8]